MKAFHTVLGSNLITDICCIIKFRVGLEKILSNFLQLALEKTLTAGNLQKPTTQG